MKKLFPASNILEMRERILNLSMQYSLYVILDSCPQAIFENIPLHYKMIAGFGAIKKLTVNQNALNKLNDFLSENGDCWKFGMLSYDLKNEIEHLSSNNNDAIQFPLLHFFIPEIVIGLKENCVEIECLKEETAEGIYHQLLNSVHKKFHLNNAEFVFPEIEDYSQTIDKIKYHLHRGDIYEMNYCIQLLQQCSIDPLPVYKNLTQFSPSPFSCFAKVNEHYLMSASPERFIAKKGLKIFSQPMKGTSKRSKNKTEDDILKNQLWQNEKERAENVMIVDLVRNDLSRIANRGSVKVDELFGVYTFPAVHQMISTVSAGLREGIFFTDIIKAMFPMGSMTGAPKVRAMQLIEEVENFKRGIFSGSVGYIDPNGDFDFNVVIRSIIYNSETNQLSIPAGSAITAKSHPMQEYNECLLKAKGMLTALGIAEPANEIRQ